MYFQIQALSFTLLEDEVETDEDQHSPEECNQKSSISFKRTTQIWKFNRKKVKKDPTVDTSFLPDREREEEENQLREELRQQWAQQQQKLKDEEIEITFSYWDGSGHRKTVRVKKGLFFIYIGV